MATFKELLKLSFKSEDTEEWLDVHFTRPIGLAFALLWNKFDIHPNVITILSIFLGVGAGWMFHYTDLWSNVAGVLLLMFANFCDSTDGQMARLTGKKTLIGRMLDGFSGDVWFFAIYIGIVVRLWNQNIPFTNIHWGFWGFLLCAVAGFGFHSKQSSLADYYRQIHLYFLLGFPALLPPVEGGALRVSSPAADHQQPSAHEVHQPAHVQFTCHHHLHYLSAGMSVGLSSARDYRVPGHVCLHASHTRAIVILFNDYPCQFG